MHLASHPDEVICVICNIFFIIYLTISFFFNYQRYFVAMFIHIIHINLIAI